MTCDDVELELSGEAPTEGARAHAAGCPRCRQTMEVLGLARLAPPPAALASALAGLPASTQAAAVALVASRAPSPVRRAGGLLLAAGVGAFLASAALLSRPEAPQVRVEFVHVAPPEVPALDVDEPNLFDDEGFEEVGWPSPTEGEL